MELQEPLILEREITNAGAEWVRQALKVELSPVGVRAANLIDEWLSGIYHLTPNPRHIDWTAKDCIEVRFSRDLSSYDGSLLTRLVFLAHDHALRVEVEPCNMQMLKLRFHERSREGERTCERHPSLEQALDTWRTTYPLQYGPAQPELADVDTFTLIAQCRRKGYDPCAHFFEMKQQRDAAIGFLRKR